MVIVRLSDSVLAFHKHGVQGRSLKNGEVTQEIVDSSRTYKLLGSDKYVIIFCKFTHLLIIVHYFFKVSIYALTEKMYFALFENLLNY